MSKKFKGKTCVYCTIPGSSAVGDHVLGREFCLADKRDNLPQVPACLACNGENGARDGAPVGEPLAVRLIGDT